MWRRINYGNIVKTFKTNSIYNSNNSILGNSFRNRCFYSTVNTSSTTPINNININNINTNKKDHDINNNKQENNKQEDNSNKQDNNNNDEHNFNEGKRSNARDEQIKNFDERKKMILFLCKVGGLYYLFRVYVLDFTICQGTSMQPTLGTGDIVLIDRLTKDYKVDDLIVAISPTSGDFSICKRIRFVEGDEILFDSPSGDLIRYIVPKGYVWIEGDNPDTSRDSRKYGAIPRKLISGKVVMRLNPISLFNEPPPPTRTEKIN